jgi:hypothetical protein
MGIYRSIKDFVRVEMIERARLLSIALTRMFYKNTLRQDKEKKRKFIFNTQYIHSFSELEFMVAAQLQLKGHEVIMLGCDGLPYSERETVDLPNIKSYKSCSSRTQRYCSAYGLKYIKLNSFLDEKGKRDAHSLSLGPISEIQNYTENNINLGEYAKRNHAHYFKGDINPIGEFQCVFRKAFEAGYLTMLAMIRVLDKYPGYDLVTANGKFIQSGIPVELAQAANRSYYTYEVFGQGNGVILDKDCCSLEQRMDKVWDELKVSSLSADAITKLYHSFDLQQKSLSSEFDLWDKNRIDDDKQIVSMLGLNLKQKIYVCYPNVYWDSVHFGVKGVTSNITDWLIAMIKYAKDNEDIQLVIRCHPGEIKVSKFLKSKFTMLDTLCEAFDVMPGNVRLIDPESNISSYSLARIADANMVWNGTMGLEIALRGTKPIVVADSYFSNKGFTVDFMELEDLTDYLSTVKSKVAINEKEKRLLEIFCYHVRFNRKFNPPFYRGVWSLLYRFSQVEPGNNETLDNMVGFFLNKNSYLNVGNFNFD